MRVRDFAFQAMALGALLAMAAACGGIVSKGDTCTGNGSGSTGGSPEGACPPSGQSPGADQGPASGGGTEGPASGGGTTSRIFMGSSASSVRISSVATTAVSVIQTGTTTRSIGQEYSQNAPLPTGDPNSSEVTCYGATDGSTCSVSDINFVFGSTVRSVVCSGADGRCSCSLTPQSSSGTVTSTFPFTAGLCPIAAAGTNGAIGGLPPEVCSKYAEALFAACDW